VEDLRCCRLENKPFSYFQFKVKPAERAKTEDGQSTYNCFFILKSSAKVHVAYCPCKGGIDGACKHVAAALLDLQSMVSSNLTNTCTSEKCLWKRRNRNSDYAIRLEDLNIVKAEFGKEETPHLKPEGRGRLYCFQVSVWEPLITASMTSHSNEWALRAACWDCRHWRRTTLVKKDKNQP